MRALVIGSANVIQTIPSLALFGLLLPLPWLGARAGRLARIRVTIRDVPTTRVAIMEHRGDPATIGATIQRFIAWRKAAGLHPKTSPTFNVWRSERRPASPADYSVDLCVGTDQPIEPNGEQIKAGEIPGGRCAVLRVVGNTDNLEPAALYLYRDWLPASGEEARDFPIYCQRLSFFPEVPEHETVAELFLPLK